MSARVKWSIGMIALAAAASCGRGGGEAARAAPPDTAAATRVAPPAVSAARDGRRAIVFVGTSLTAGLGLDPDSAFTALIQQRIDSVGLNYDVVNAGVSGETSAGALRRIDWVMRQRVDIVVLEVGANDGLRALSVDSLRSNLQQIIDRVRAAQSHAQIVLVGMQAPPNLGMRYTSAFRKVYSDLARTNHVVLLPFLLAGVAGVDSLNQGDGIHPNSRGERIVAETVWRTLAPLLKQGEPLDPSARVG